MGDAHGAAQHPPQRIGVLLGPAPSVEHPVRDHVHRGVEVEILPVGGARTAVAHGRDPGGHGHQLRSSCVRPRAPNSHRPRDETSNSPDRIGEIVGP